MAAVPAATGNDVLLHLPDCIGNIADDFNAWEIDRVNLGSFTRYMNDLGSTRFHEKRWLFDDVMPDVDDAIRRFDGAVDKITRGQGGAAQKFRMTLINHALAQLGRQKRDAGLLDKLQQHPASHRPVGASANDKHRRFGIFQRFDRGADRFRVSAGTARYAAFDRQSVGMFVSNIFGQFDMDRAGLFFLG